MKWIKWEKLTVRKEDGGLNFRNLLGFNLAMLGKQGWKFISHPNAMVSRFFKAKYFRTMVFLNSNTGHSPSFIWRSIYCSWGLIKDGLRWQIGDGSRINMWQHQWLKGINNNSIGDAPHLSISQLNVKDLVVPNTRAWDINFTTALVPQQATDKIMKILLLEEMEDDSRIWRHTKDGCYSVKS
ncbi:hypothetical protein GLYMA_18G177350v4 [Glycine max]|nr:hypothetical protein GLYMA_18G177350v4 [Glycine max]KAH1154964.1 hypothetical protein GYH30_050307 [Glycine max]